MDKLKRPALEECLYREVLSCGLSLYFWPRRGLRKKHALLAVDFGSIDRRFLLGATGESVELPAGSAHFLEHRLFECEEGDVDERFAALGAEVNAHTSFGHTAYFFSTVEHFDESLALLLDFTLDLHMGAGGIERERKIVAQEIRLYRDSVDWVSFFQVLGTLYRDEFLNADIAGTLESIEQIDSALLQWCHTTFYHPRNMALFVCGDLEAASLLEQVESYFKRRGPEPPPEGMRQRRPGPSPGPFGRASARLDIARTRLSLGFRDREEGKRGGALLRRELAMEMLLDALFGPASTFYCQHYASGLIEAESFDYEVCAEPEFSFCWIGGDSKDPRALEELLIAEMLRAKKSPGIEEAFPRSRRKALGHLLQHLDTVESCAELVHSAVSRGGEPFDFFDVYARVTPEDMRACLESWLDPENYGISQVYPLEMPGSTSGESCARS